MPEIKHQFTGGKMNKDLDERLIPNGEYKDAMNIQVSTSEGSEVGTVQNILGNISGCTYGNGSPITTGSSTVGSISDEKNDTLYWFVAGPNPTLEDLYDTTINPSLEIGGTTLSLPVYNKDLIMRRTLTSCEPVFADVYSLLLENTTNLPTKEIFYQDFTFGQRSVKPGMYVMGVGSNGNSNIVKVSSLTDTSSSPIIYLNEALDLVTNGPFEYLYFYKDRVLNFDKDKLITGINIIDDMLFWTDNVTEPKKISISRSFEGTDSSGNIHTELINEAVGIGLTSTSNEVLIREEHITVIKKSPKTPLTLNLETDRKPGKNYTGVIDIVSDPSIPTIYTQDPSFSNISNTPWSYPDDIYDFSTLQVGDVFYVRIETNLSGSGGFILNGIATEFWTTGTKVVLKEFVNSTTPPVIPIKDTYTIKGQIVSWIDPTSGTGLNSHEQIVDPVTGNITQEAQFAIKITAMNGIPPKAHGSVGVLKYVIDVFSESEKLFEFKFPRFSYRYKYQDGEYSSFAPFTEVGFSPGSFDYHPKKGYNLGMTNRITKIEVQGFNTQDIPLDVVEIDLLYKDDASPNIYIVDTINPMDEPDIASGSNAWDLDKYIITSDTIYAVVPSNQLLRPWDNVPRKALAQEITGNRIVYGNYLQNYDLTLPSADGVLGKEFYPTFQHNIVPSGTTLDPFNRDNIRSIKSLRDYQLGVVFIDEYGRETPVISNPSGTFKIAKSQAADENRLEVGFPGSSIDNVPPIFKYYKFFIKETSGEYYNLAMDRFYDAEDGNYWLAFPSSERNKIDIDTILILKKTVNSSALIVEPAKYKILAIENEAPDFIKTKLHNIGEAKNCFGTTLSNSPVSGTSSFELFSAEFDTSSAADMHEVKEPVFVEFQDTSNIDLSDRYRVTSMSKSKNSGGVNKFYIKLDEPLGGDVDFMLKDLLVPSLGIKDTIIARFFKNVVENEPKFDGRFFVKIYADDIFNTYVRLPQRDLSNVNKRVVASKKVYYMAENHVERHSSKVAGDFFGANAAVWGGLDPSDDDVNSNNYSYGIIGQLHGNIINQLVNPVDPFIKQLSGPNHPELQTGLSGTSYSPSSFKTEAGVWKNYQIEARDGTISFYTIPTSGGIHDHIYPSAQQSWELLLADGTRPKGENYSLRQVLHKNDGHTGQNQYQATTTMGWFSLPGSINYRDAWGDSHYGVQTNSHYDFWGGQWEMSWCIPGGGGNCGSWRTAAMPPSIMDWYYYTAYFATYSERTIQPRLAVPPADPTNSNYSTNNIAPNNENYDHIQWSTSSSIASAENFIWGDPHMYYDVLNEKNSTDGYEDVWFIDDGKYVGENSVNQEKWKYRYNEDSADGVFYNQRISVKYPWGCLEQDPDSGDGLQFSPCEGDGLLNYPDPNDNYGTMGLSFGGINPETRLEEKYHGHVDPNDSGTIKAKDDSDVPPTESFQQFFIRDADIEMDNFWDLTGASRNKYISEVPFIEKIDSGFQFRWKEDPTGQVYTIEFPPDEYNRLRYDSLPLDKKGKPRLDVHHLAGLQTGGVATTYLDDDGTVVPVTVQSAAINFPLNIGNRIENFFKNYNVTFNPALTWDPIQGGTPGAIVDGKYIDKYISDQTIDPPGTTALTASATTTANKIKISKTQYEASYDSKYKIREPITKGMILTSVNGSTITPVLINNIEDQGGDYEITFIGYQGTNASVTVSATHTLIFEQPTMNGLSVNSARNITNHNTSTDGIGAVGYTLEFLEADERGDMLPVNPAIWETEPKDSADLDIYYEISGNNVINLDDSTIDTALPVGSLVSVFGAASTTSVGGGTDSLQIIETPIPTVTQPDEYNIITLSEPLCIDIAVCLGITPVAVDDIFHITRTDGTTFDVIVESVISPSQFKIKPFLYDTWHKLNWFNCYSFGNGVESDRIRDNFNVPFISNGVKASTTLEYKYKEEHRKNGLIFSGIYNSNSGVNDLNQFIQAEQITKDVNPIYGSIQKLYSQSTAQGDLITLCEDRILKILANKDAIYNADGNPQLTANNNVLGQAIPYAGEFGISTNPESFASEAYRAYFSDRVRGVIMRLSKDGLTPISMYGMKDWFKDNLKLSNKVIGSYDDKKDEYNVSLSYSYKGYPAKILGISKSGYPPFDTTGAIVVSGEVAQHFSVDDVMSGYGIPAGAFVKSITHESGGDWWIMLKDASGGNITDFDITELGSHYGYGLSQPEQTRQVYWITGISADLTRNIPIATVSFREDVKGWVSFKSFFPENAISCANDYYTFLHGNLYKHHVEYDNNGGIVDRNTFYNDFTPSSLNVILNDAPGMVKSFNTLNYEGSQTKVDVSYDDNDIIINDGEYYNLEPKKGWYVESVETDKEKGSLNEFIEKEGKWFNYLRGQNVITNDDNSVVINEDGSSSFDQASFAIQGIGQIHPNPCVYGCMDANAINYSGAATCDNGSCAYVEPVVICGVETPTPSWDCEGNSCYDPGTGNGQYTSLSACNIACDPSPTTSWDCDGEGNCSDPGNGSGQYTSLYACQSACVIGVTPSWDCDPSTGICSDPGTGLGQYSSLSYCQWNSVCGNAPTSCLECVGLDEEVEGCCSMPNAVNYNCATAINPYEPGITPCNDGVTCDDGSCVAILYGCMDSGLLDQTWWDDPSVINQGANTGIPYSTVTGVATYPGYEPLNYFVGANIEDGNCIYGPPPSWDCDGQGNCSDPGTGNGTYSLANGSASHSAAEADCQANCIIPSWQCDHLTGICSDPGTGNGTWPTENDCQDNCVAPTYLCAFQGSGICYDPGDGSGNWTDKIACENACAQSNVPESWTCLNGDCIDLGLGTGNFSTETACNNNCASIIGPAGCGVIAQFEGCDDWNNVMDGTTTTYTLEYLTWYWYTTLNDLGYQNIGSPPVPLTFSNIQMFMGGPNGCCGEPTEQGDLMGCMDPAANPGNYCPLCTVDSGYCCYTAGCGA